MKYIFITIAALLLLQISSYKDDSIDSTKQIRLEEIGYPALRVDYCISKYCKQYNVPKELVERCAHIESTYIKNDICYIHNKRGLGGLGVLQMSYRTAKTVFPDSSFTEYDLLNNIDLNVHISVKHIANLYAKYKDWGVVFSAYNQGEAYAYNINEYSRKIY